MNESRNPPAGQRIRSADWRALARRNWLIVGAVMLALVLGAWALSRRGARAQSAGSSGSSSGAVSTEEKAGVDSVVTLDSASLQLVAIEVRPASALAGSGLVANGTITYDANHVSVVAPRAEGRVSAVRADLGQRVGPGSVLAILESPEIGQSRGDVARAEAALEVAQQNYDREKSLFEQQVSSQKSMLEAQAAYRSAQADYNAARARNRALGASGAAAPDAGGSYALVTPVGGTVVERNAMPGQIAGPQTNLFTVADLRHVWINVDVYESDLARVHNGAAARVTTRAMPGETFRGRVTFAGGVVDSTTRTVKVRVEVENPGQRLRPGMYAEVRIDALPDTLPAQTAAGPVVLPDIAVQDLNGKSVVFVPAGAPGRFVARAVILGTRVGDGLVSITSGLRSGDSVVVKGAFQLKSELMKASFGGDES